MLRLLREIYPNLGRRLSLLALLQGFAASAEAGIILLTVSLTAAAGGSMPRGTPALSLLGTEEWSRPSMMPLLAALGAALVLRAGVQFLGIRLWAHWVEDYERSHRDSLLEGLLAADWTCQSREPAGRLQHVLTHHTECLTKAFTSLSWSCAHLLTGLILAVSALLTSPVVSVAGAALMLSFATILNRLSRRSRHAAARRAAALGSYVNLLGQSLPLLRELRVFGADSKLRGRAGAIAADISGSRRIQNVMGAVTPCFYQAAAGLTLVVGLLLCALYGHSAAAALAGLVLLVRAASSAQHGHITWHQLQESLPFLDEIRDTLRGYAAARVPGAGVSLDRIDSLECVGVDFAYDANRPVLCDVRLHAERGEVIAVVGPSGEGKSTLLHLMLRLLTPTRGGLLVNGRPVELYSTESWYARTAFVPQEPALFQESIAECIRFDRDAITDEQIALAATEAGLREEIAEMPEGLATPVGERGAQLSFGQRQRVCIARALAGRPDLLILDEPTAALDADSEERIVQTLQRLRGSTTVFVVTHRPALLRACDRIVEVRHGRAMVQSSAPSCADDYNLPVRAA